MKTSEAQTPALSGAGLGLRRALTGPLLSVDNDRPDFLEVAPENWIRAGGRCRRDLDALAERYSLASHGLSLSIGSPDPLDADLLDSLRQFIDRYNIRYYTEHLSYCSEAGHLYDLLPMPFCEEAVYYVAARIRQVQEHLGQRIGMENISYYADFGDGMSESDFISAVANEADCDILLDVNNVYVNSINHRYDPRAFIDSLPLSRVKYLHVAGHYDEDADLKIDTHGAAVIDPVWELLEYTYRMTGPLPTLLERDFNLPPLGELMQEVSRVRSAQSDARATVRMASSQ
ncbi:DUF692 domain-containing protein [Chromatocurvus halotolerans]|uniref:UPF0276 protein EV688_102320 n=1 Tax=Chromatocurvus halotolerans TaxID=1132028 RepID=A0A4V2SC35_9GAMM|nr:DUF692 domain-containing protein [Chromatocurvus halotolerans]TCO77860.1 hypothetical protein EV688_102320 [Chromatocurvus halotolerans]